MAQHKVTAAAVVVPIGGTERYLYRGAVVPDGVKAADVKRLKESGLIEEVKAPTKTAAEKKAEAEAAAKAKADADAQAKADAEAAAKAAGDQK